MDVPSHIVRAGSEATRIWISAMEAGSGEKFAEMCALQTPPGTKGSDRAFFEGRSNQQQFDDMPVRQARWLLKEAQEAGINPTGKYYLGGLADKRGWRDPKAWVSSVDDVKKVAQERNLHVEGAVTVEGRPVPPKRTVLNDRIIREEQRKNPRLSRQEIIEKHAHPSKKKGK